MHHERYRTVFAFPRMVEDLLRGFAAREWATALDFSTLRKLPAEYVSDERLVRRGDTVWQVCLLDCGPVLVVLVPGAGRDSEGRVSRGHHAVRRYLGEHYAAPSNVTASEAGGRPRALPLTTIYFLGHRLAHTDATVLKVGREYVDAVTGERLREREEFVESLTHDSYVIQIPLLPDHRRNDLERLMGVFDQSRRTSSRHFLEVDESELPPKYAPVLRRLLGAAGSREVRDAMIVEDEGGVASGAQGPAHRGGRRGAGRGHCGARPSHRRHCGARPSPRGARPGHRRARGDHRGARPGPRGARPGHRRARGDRSASGDRARGAQTPAG